MAKILLDYIFPISVVESTPAASTAFLKQAVVVAKPKSGQEGNVGTTYECATMTEVAARTDNTNAQQLFNAGMSKVFILLSDDLDLADGLAAIAGEAYTLLISDDFVDTDLGNAASGSITISAYASLLTGTEDTIEVAGVEFTAQSGSATLGDATFQAADDDATTAVSLAAQINGHATAASSVSATVATSIIVIEALANGVAGNALTLDYTDNGGGNIGASVTGSGTLAGGVDNADYGAFDGVIGYSSQDSAFADTFGNTARRVGFYGNVTNKAKNMFYAFGKLLSNVASWKNQQYISMPFSDGVALLGTATGLFDDRVSFVLDDDEFGSRLGLFAAGGKAIVEPYISKNIRLDIQSAALTWISANQPGYTLSNAALLEQRLQEDVIKRQYVDRGLITDGTIAISLVQDNFVANGDINIAEPKAWWRIVGEMQSTL